MRNFSVIVICTSISIEYFDEAENVANRMNVLPVHGNVCGKTWSFVHIKIIFPIKIIFTNFISILANETVFVNYESAYVSYDLYDKN